MWFRINLALSCIDGCSFSNVWPSFVFVSEIIRLLWLLLLYFIEYFITCFFILQLHRTRASIFFAVVQLSLQLSFLSCTVRFSCSCWLESVCLNKQAASRSWRAKFTGFNERPTELSKLCESVSVHRFFDFFYQCMFVCLQYPEAASWPCLQPPPSDFWPLLETQSLPGEHHPSTWCFRPFANNKMELEMMFSHST